VKTNRDASRLAQDSTLQRYLHDAGYRTGIFGKFLNRWDLSVAPPFFDRWAIFNGSYYNNVFNVDGTLTDIGQYSTDYITSRAIDFLNESESNDDQQWLLFVTVYAPHDPYTPEPAYEDSFVPQWYPSPGFYESDRSDKPPYVRARTPPTRRTMADRRRRQYRTLRSVDDTINALFHAMSTLKEGARRWPSSFPTTATSGRARPERKDLSVYRIDPNPLLLVVAGPCGDRFDRPPTHQSG